MAENKELALVLRLVADQFQSELKNSQGSLGQFNSFIKDWKTQLVAASAALFAVTKSTANYGDQLAKMAQRLGTTVEETARLQHAARLSDTDLHGLSSSVAFLSNKMLDAARSNREAQRDFAQLGVTTTTTSGALKGTTDILLELSDRLRLMPEGPEKLALAMSVMGRSAKDVLPFMNSNLREAFQETKELGLEMSTRTAKAAEQFNDQLEKLQGAAQGVSHSIGEMLLPQFTSLTKILTTITADAGSALRALLSLDKLEASQVGVVQPDGGGRRLRIVPPPPADVAKQFSTQPFFKTPEQAAADQERVAKERERLARELARQGQEQEKLGKALLDIYLAQNRALEIRNKLQGGQGQLSEFFLAFDRQQQFRQEDEAAEQRKGQLIVDQTRMQVQVRDAALQRERDGLIQNLQAWIAYDNQVGASTELRLEHQLDLVQANLAKQLQLTNEQAGQLITAWQNIDSQTQDQILNQTQLNGQERITIELQTLTQLAAIHQQFSGDIFQGWTLGLQRYLQDTQSAFGFAADLARRTAQQMEGAFRTFFFDLMDEKITSLKDLFQSFANFAKQMIAQVMAQLATMAVLKGLTGGFGGFGGFGSGLSDLFGGGGFGAAQTPLFGFANGGPVLGAGNSDSVRAMLTPGEGVLSRKGMQTLATLNSGTVPAAASPNVVVNFHGVQPGEVPQVNYRRQFEGMVVDVILRNRDLQGMLGMAR